MLAELRRETPVATISDGMRYVTRYEACRAALRDVASFSNASGFKAPGVEVPPRTGSSVSSIHRDTPRYAG